MLSSNLRFKAQLVRLADVFLIGPLMIWGGIALAERKRELAGASLATLGAATIVFNAYGFAVVRRLG